MSEVVFEPLPERRNGVYGQWAELLRARPGEWARIPIKASGGAIRQHWGPKGFEFAQRTVDGTPLIYGRYIGNGVEHQ